MPLDVIFRAVTLENVQAFGLDAEIGSVEAGKRANLLLLRANPRESIEAYDQIDLVILRGQVLAREQLIARPE